MAVSTLNYDQMVDLLKTSPLVTLTVIPPINETTPRKGCTLQNCKYNEASYEGDYENLNVGADENGGKNHRKAPQLQQAVPGNHRRVYERSFSPPRSSNSSGYGTGSSSKSFLGAGESRFPTNQEVSKFKVIKKGNSKKIKCIAKIFNILKKVQYIEFLQMQIDGFFNCAMYRTKIVVMLICTTKKNIKDF